MPAAAVIPAPIAYIKVVAVKKLVVGFWARSDWSAVMVCTAGRLRLILLGTQRLLLNCVRWWTPDFYFEEIRVFKAGIMLEYVSME